MKLVASLTLICSSLLAFGQEITVKVSGSIFNSKADSIYIAEFIGPNYINHKGEKLKKDGTFTIATKLPKPDYYVLRVGKEHINIILRDESDIKIYGDGTQINKHVNFVGSDESHAMNYYLRFQNEWNIKRDSAVALIKASPSKRNEINQSMSGEYNRFRSLQQNFVTTNRNSAALYPVLNQIDPENDFATYETIVKQLVYAFGDSPSIKKVQRQYEQRKLMRQAKDKLAPGKEAPDFEEAMADGSTMKLSDLRGQYVLLDFWASWCGPCRRENPHVVRLYNKYKDQGFTVMSVSLDKSKDSWLKAIKKDGLTWPNHVSDLKYWQSKAAQLYGVRGIPFTVLIDKEGKIIRTKLRAHDLEQELHRIFGF